MWKRQPLGGLMGLGTSPCDLRYPFALASLRRVGVLAPARTESKAPGCKDAPGKREQGITAVGALDDFVPGTSRQTRVGDMFARCRQVVG